MEFAGRVTRRTPPVSPAKSVRWDSALDEDGGEDLEEEGSGDVSEEEEDGSEDGGSGRVSEGSEDEGGGGSPLGGAGGGGAGVGLEPWSPTRTQLTLGFTGMLDALAGMQEDEDEDEDGEYVPVVGEEEEEGEAESTSGRVEDPISKRTRKEGEVLDVDLDALDAQLRMAEAGDEEEEDEGFEDRTGDYIAWRQFLAGTLGPLPAAGTVVSGGQRGDDDDDDDDEDEEWAESQGGRHRRRKGGGAGSGAPSVAGSRASTGLTGEEGEYDSDEYSDGDEWWDFVEDAEAIKALAVDSPLERPGSKAASAAGGGGGKKRKRGGGRRVVAGPATAPGMASMRVPLPPPALIPPAALMPLAPPAGDLALQRQPVVGAGQRAAGPTGAQGSMPPGLQPIFTPAQIGQLYCQISQHAQLLLQSTSIGAAVGVLCPPPPRTSASASSATAKCEEAARAAVAAGDHARRLLAELKQFFDHAQYVSQFVAPFPPACFPAAANVNLVDANPPQLLRMEACRAWEPEVGSVLSERRLQAAAQTLGPLMTHHVRTPLDTPLVRHADQAQQVADAHVRKMCTQHILTGQKTRDAVQTLIAEAVTGSLGAAAAVCPGGPATCIDRGLLAPPEGIQASAGLRPVKNAQRKIFSAAEDRLLALGVHVWGNNWDYISRTFLPCWPAQQLYHRYKNLVSLRGGGGPGALAVQLARDAYRSPLTAAEAALLDWAVRKHGCDWEKIALNYFPARHSQQLAIHWNRTEAAQKSGRLKRRGSKRQPRRAEFNPRSSSGGGNGVISEKVIASLPPPSPEREDGWAAVELDENPEDLVPDAREQGTESPISPARAGKRSRGPKGSTIVVRPTSATDYVEWHPSGSDDERQPPVPAPAEDAPTPRRSLRAAATAARDAMESPSGSVPVPTAPAPVLAPEDDREVLVDGEMTVWSQMEDRALLLLAKSLAPGGNVQGCSSDMWDALGPEQLPEELRRMRPRLLKERYAKLMRIFQERRAAAIAPAVTVGAHAGTVGGA